MARLRAVTVQPQTVAATIAAPLVRVSIALVVTAPVVTAEEAKAAIRPLRAAMPRVLIAARMNTSLALPFRPKLLRARPRPARA